MISFNNSEYKPYFSQIFKLAQSIPITTKSGIILTSVDPSFKHSYYFNSLVKYIDPNPNLNVKQKDQLYNTVPRFKKFPKKNLDQLIFDGTIHFLNQKNPNNLSFYPLNMMYLFESMKYAKIILVINQFATTDSMLQKIKDTLFRFVQSFSKERLHEIIKCVGIMVLDSTVDQKKKSPNQVFLKRISQIKNLDHSREKYILDMLKQIIKQEKITYCKKKPEVSDEQRDNFAALCSKLSNFQTINCMFMDQERPNNSLNDRNVFFKNLFFLQLQEVINKSILKNVIQNLSLIISPKTRQDAQNSILQKLTKDLEVESITPGQQQVNLLMNFKKEKFNNKMSFISDLKNTRQTEKLIKFYLSLQKLIQDYQKSQDKILMEKNMFHLFFQIFFKVDYIPNKEFQKILRQIQVLSTKMKKFQFNVLKDTIFQYFFEKKLNVLVDEIEMSLDSEISKFKTKEKSLIAAHLSEIVTQFILNLKKNKKISKRLIQKMIRRKIIIDLEKIKFQTSNEALLTLIQCQTSSRQCGLFQDQNKSQHFCNIYQRIGDCLAEQKKHDQALKFYNISNSHWKIRGILYEKFKIDNFFNFKVTLLSSDQFRACIDWLMNLGLEEQARKICYVCIQVFKQQKKSFNEKLNQIRAKTQQKHLEYLTKVANNDNPIIERDILQSIKTRASLQIKNKALRVY